MEFNLKKYPLSGFTLIELLVVIAILGLLASIILVSINGATNKAKVSSAATQQRELHKAIQLYEQDMGFYPPDTGRGADPGFSKPLPFNDDVGVNYDCNIDFTPCSGLAGAQVWLPTNWKDRVNSSWRGPYIAIYPQNTPWKGEYDYNYWPVGADRYGCAVLPGIYIGVQGDYSNNNTIPQMAEQTMIDNRYEDELCINGESQMLLVRP